MLGVRATVAGEHTIFEEQMGDHTAFIQRYYSGDCLIWDQDVFVSFLEAVHLLQLSNPPPGGV